MIKFDLFYFLNVLFHFYFTIKCKSFWPYKALKKLIAIKYSKIKH